MRELRGGEHTHGQGNRHESEVRPSATLVCGWHQGACVTQRVCDLSNEFFFFGGAFEEWPGARACACGCEQNQTIRIAHSPAWIIEDTQTH